MNIPSFGQTLRLLLSHAVVHRRVEDVQVLEHAERQLGFHLPANYKAFLMAADGCATADPLNVYRFFSVSQALERWSASDHPPDTLPIASDDSTEFAFDLRRKRATSAFEIVEYPTSSTDLADVEWLAEDLAEFLWLITRRLGPRRLL